VPFLKHARRCVEAVPDVVAVEHETANSQRVQLVVHQVRHGALAAAAETRQPHDTSLVAIEGLAILPGNGVLVPNDVNLLAHRGALF
jgi:hypothetical protein